MIVSQLCGIHSPEMFNVIQCLLQLGSKAFEQICSDQLQLTPQEDILWPPYLSPHAPA